MSFTFDPQITPKSVNALRKNSMTEFLDIRCTEVGKDFIKATMPVDNRTRQTYGLLHGGASVVLAETLGSTAAHFTLDTSKQHAVGLEINANHVRSVKSGTVTGITTPIHIGKKTQVWEIKIYNEDEKLICISRLTVAIIDH